MTPLPFELVPLRLGQDSKPVSVRNFVDERGGEVGVRREQVDPGLVAVFGNGILRQPPSNRLETLSGNRAGQWSIRVNRQWRICFVFHEGNAFDVELTDYH